MTKTQPKTSDLAPYEADRRDRKIVTYLVTSKTMGKKEKAEVGGSERLKRNRSSSSTVAPSFRHRTERI
jgi:hypothetical protein